MTRTILKKSSILFVLLVFAITLINTQIVIIGSSKDNTLRDAITQIQALSDQIHIESTENFANAFSSSIIALQVTAGLKSVFILLPDSPGDKASTSIVLTVKTPYLTIDRFMVPLDCTSNDLVVMEYTQDYTSIISQPETPPPNIV